MMPTHLEIEAAAITHWEPVFTVALQHHIFDTKNMIARLIKEPYLPVNMCFRIPKGENFSSVFLTSQLIQLCVILLIRPYPMISVLRKGYKFHDFMASGFHDFMVL